MNNLILSIVKQNQNMAHMRVPETMTGAWVISSSGIPSDDGASSRNAVPDAVPIANPIRKFDNLI